MSPATQKRVKCPCSFMLRMLIVACAGKQQPTGQVSFVTSNQKPSTSTSKPFASPGAQALDVARQMLDASYRYGGTGPRGFDCSGLIGYTFNQNGIELPRTSREIFRISQRIDPQKIEPGDLIFFATSANKISHVDIYAGQNRFIHSPSSGKAVNYAELDNHYWQKRLIKQQKRL